MTKQLIDLVLEAIKEKVTSREYDEVRLYLEDYEDLKKDYIELLNDV